MYNISLFFILCLWLRSFNCLCLYFNFNLIYKNNMELVYAIDVGGTNTVYGIVDVKGRIHFKATVYTTQFDSFGSLVSFISDRFKLQSQLKNYPAPKGIGIGAPNGNNRTGAIEYAPNLPWKKRIKVNDILGREFGCDCKLDNDANLAALGEKKFGIAAPYSDFLMVTLGTGLGSGIFINNQLVQGYDGYAGELGNTIVVPGGRKHRNMDLNGCLEAYVSATGLVETAKEMLKNSGFSKNSKMADHADSISAKQIFDCAAAQDPLANECIISTARMLGLGLANYILINSPQAIILFGGMAAPLFRYQSVIVQSVNENLPSIFRNKTSLLLSSLAEADAALLGAAAQLL